MNVYKFVKPLLFKLDSEQAHHLSLTLLNLTHKLGLGSLLNQPKQKHEVQLAGIQFPNPVGLAAGLDKDGKYIDALANLGFGFIEIGTVTPKSQAGNPKPRMFRLPQALGIINRMGFNNDGVLACIERVKASRYWQQGGILGINIGKNAATPIEQSIDDYNYCLEMVYPFATYITINISSPNTKNLRQLQNSSELDQFLGKINQKRSELRDTYQVHKPLFLKIAPDLDHGQIQEIAELLVRHQIDGVIATNTTIDHDAVKSLPHAQEVGGLSGAPVFVPSNFILSELRRLLGPDYPIIGVGGITTGHDAYTKQELGAQLVQVYTGLIYRGPQLISECIKSMR